LGASFMQAFNDLRQAARDRRDKAILAICEQYEGTVPTPSTSAG